MHKYRHLIPLMLLAAAFLIRIYSAVILPSHCEEEEKAGFAGKISFNPSSINLPIGDCILQNPLLSIYILKASYAVFGENKVGGRVVFVLLGTCSLYFIYKLTEEAIGRRQGLLTLIILAFEQFHIGTTRIVSVECLLRFFSALAMYSFFKAIHTENRKWIYLTAIAVGIGYLGKESIILLLPVFLIFIVLNKKYRLWLRRKETYLAFIVTLIFISPHFLWSVGNNFCNYTADDAGKLGMSLRGFYLFFAEIFSWIVQRLNFFIWDIDKETISIKLSDGSLNFLSSVSSEIPFIHWPLSLLIFISIFYCLRRNHGKNELINFSLIMFSFVFIATSVISGEEFFDIDQHWWASLTLYPGVILCSQMLTKLKEQYKFANFAVFGFIIYFIIHSFYFISLPENIFAVPKNETCKYCLRRAEIYLRENKRNDAIKRCTWVIGMHPDEEISNQAKKLLRDAEK